MKLWISAGILLLLAACISTEALRLEVAELRHAVESGGDVVAQLDALDKELDDTDSRQRNRIQFIETLVYAYLGISAVGKGTSVTRGILKKRHERLS